VSASGFNFSKPTFTLKKNPHYKGLAFAKKKSTIVCAHAKTLKRVRAFDPRCPKGFHRRLGHGADAGAVPRAILVRT
jgi:hypothetical protein